MLQFVTALIQQNDVTKAIVTFSLILVRIMTIILLVPFLGGKNAPMEIKMGVGVTLTLVVWPIALSALTGDVPVTAMGFTILMIKEAMVGLTLGFVVSKIFYAVEMAGQVMDTVRGVNQIQLQVPHIEERSSALGTLYYQLLLALFLASGLHQPFIEALFLSYKVVPINDFPAFSQGLYTFMDAVIVGTADILFVAIQLAMPVGVVSLVVEAVFGMMNRVAPQINAYQLAQPAKVLASVWVLVFAMNIITDRMLESSGEILEQVFKLLGLMS